MYSEGGEGAGDGLFLVCAPAAKEKRMEEANVKNNYVKTEAKQRDFLECVNFFLKKGGKIGFFTTLCQSVACGNSGFQRRKMPLRLMLDGPAINASSRHD